MFNREMIVTLLLIIGFHYADGQNKKAAEAIHYVCFQPTGEYHDKEHCARLQICSGGRNRRVKDVRELKPCPKCAKPVQSLKSGSGFTDIKNVLGVKDKRQIIDSLGTSEGTIHRPAGFTIRITGLPGSKTVNTIEFFFDKPVVFNEDSVLSKNFLDQLGLKFDLCTTDTIRNTTPHPVTGKVSKDVSIEYRGCAVVEAADAYEDMSKYYYELLFLTKEGSAVTELEKIQLNLRVGG